MSTCIVNVGHGGWYPKGSARLERSLIHHGFDGHIQTWKDSLPPGSPTHQQVPYAMKVYALQWALDNGYHSTLWLDCSAWCVKYPRVHLEAMGRDGYYLVHSGWQCDQWTNDNCLKYFGITREEAKDIPMISSGIMGINFATELGREFFAQLKGAMHAGAFHGSWTHNPEEGSGDRYRGHRHDQSCASLIAHRLGMKMHPEQVYDYYYQPTMPETVEFALAGL